MKSRAGVRLRAPTVAGYWPLQIHKPKLTGEIVPILVRFSQTWLISVRSPLKKKKEVRRDYLN